jgi:hypothetical protein
MTRRKGLVLDANILLRAVLGKRVRELLEAFEDTVTFYSPDVCFDDARKYIPDVSSRRRIDPLPGWQSWRKLATSSNLWIKVCTKTLKPWRGSA